MLKFVDQLSNEVVLNDYPVRIVSLVPSQTELLFDLELDEEVVGITRFCVHPSGWKNRKSIVGGTKNFDVEKIKSLQPDLIIGNKEENYREGIETLKKIFPVWMSDIYTFSQAIQTIYEIGALCNRRQQAQTLAEEILWHKQNFSTNAFKGKSVAYFIWKNPYMVAGANTFIHSMLSEIGLKNVFEQYNRYPPWNSEELKQFSPDWVFLSSEPYRFGKKHLEEFSEIFPASKVLLVDGEMFSWYGSRLKYAFSYFQQLQKKLTHEENSHPYR
jgi:ABC-type Fe3+-hydroxamate transport system substrate-binding protein